MHPEINPHNWLYAPHLRYGFQHVSEFVKTAMVSRGTGAVRQLLHQPHGLKQLSVAGITGRDPDSTNITYSNALALTQTDAILVLHAGQIAHEQYFHEMRPETLHLVMSCTKSYIGVLVGIAVEEGLIDLDTAIEHYLPPLSDTGFGGARCNSISI
jgi:CubicO group peptidase (beta-lactamase class C family)